MKKVFLVLSFICFSLNYSFAAEPILQVSSNHNPDKSSNNYIIGINVERIVNKNKRYAPKGKIYLRTEKVLNNSPAQKSGIRTGDRILEINGQPVSTVENFCNIIKENRYNSLLIDSGWFRKSIKIYYVTGMFLDEKLSKWLEFCPTKFMFVEYKDNAYTQEEKLANYWANRRNQFYNEITTCNQSENKDSKIACYMSVRQIELNKTNQLRNEILAQENIKLQRARLYQQIQTNNNLNNINSNLYGINNNLNRTNNYLRYGY